MPINRKRGKKSSRPRVGYQIFFCAPWLMRWGIIDSPILFLADTSIALFTVVLVGT